MLLYTVEEEVEEVHLHCVESPNLMTSDVVNV